MEERKRRESEKRERSDQNALKNMSTDHPILLVYFLIFQSLVCDSVGDLNSSPAYVLRIIRAQSLAFPYTYMCTNQMAFSGWLHPLASKGEIWGLSLWRDLKLSMIVNRLICPLTPANIYHMTKKKPRVSYRSSCTYVLRSI